MGSSATYAILTNSTYTNNEIYNLIDHTNHVDILLHVLININKDENKDNNKEDNNSETDPKIDNGKNS